MRITVDLAGLVNAEFMSKDGVPGVFIPLVPNLIHRIDRGGRHAYASFVVWPSPPTKGYDYDGKLNIPREHLDKYLENPAYAGKPRKVAWVRNGRDERPSGFVTTEDLERMLQDK